MVNTTEVTAIAATEVAAEAGAFVETATASLKADTDNPRDGEKLNSFVCQ
jgi:hypothetical protein